MTNIALLIEADLATPLPDAIKQLQLPPWDPNCPTDYILKITSNSLQLVATTDIKHPFTLDFTSKSFQYRRQHANAASELLIRAMKIKQPGPLNILDLTAGLGRDGYILASCGHRLTLLERSPVIAALLEAAIAKVTAIEPNLQMQLQVTDAKDFLQNLPATEAFDIIYLDPMFPERQKSALVKKELRILRDLAGADDNGDELLDLAKTHARYRVVVKRPRLAPPLANSKPQVSLTGTSSRFDIYTLL